MRPVQTYLVRRSHKLLAVPLLIGSAFFALGGIVTWPDPTLSSDDRIGGTLTLAAFALVLGVLGIHWWHPVIVSASGSGVWIRRLFRHLLPWEGVESFVTDEPVNVEAFAGFGPATATRYPTVVAAVMRDGTIRTIRGAVSFHMDERKRTERADDVAAWLNAMLSQYAGE